MRFSSQRSEDDFLLLKQHLRFPAVLRGGRSKVWSDRLDRRQLRLKWWQRLRRRKKIKAVHILSICHSTIIQAFLKMLQVSRSHGHPAAL